MTTRAKIAAKPPRKRQAHTPAAVRIRMYNVGFGDCFLVRLPTPEGERRMLVDCGYHSQGKGEFTDTDLVGQIKEDLRGEPLDVVVATHRHQDHISGFGETALWKDIRVEEVWLPFTMRPGAEDEDPSLKAWHGMLKGVNDLFQDGKPNAATRDALGALSSKDQATVEFQLWNARANAPGIQNLMHGMSRNQGKGDAKRRFLPASKAFPSKLVTPALPGVTTHVLGPPRDPALRRARKVPSGWAMKALSASNEAAAEAAEAAALPFGAEWQVSGKRLPGRLPMQKNTLDSIKQFNDELALAARAMEGFLNGESLVLLVEIGAARLLLPGDAEVGTWSAILGNPGALALAASATFFKVGHHGSHNATPVKFVREDLSRETLAAISTKEGPGRYRNGIPFDKLIEALETRGMPFVRSDRPQAGPGTFEVGPGNRWVDCIVPC
jgi:beta-lactamase superfamily II metal-dependent hydrolase